MERDTAALTPAIREYWNLKHEHPEFLLFYQIGDFFELYFDGAQRPLAKVMCTTLNLGADAVRGAKLMDIHVCRGLLPSTGDRSS